METQTLISVTDPQAQAVPDFRFASEQVVADAKRMRENFHPDDDYPHHTLSRYDFLIDLDGYIENGDVVIYQGKNGYDFVLMDCEIAADEIVERISEIFSSGGQYTDIAEMANDLHESLNPQPDHGYSEY